MPELPQIIADLFAEFPLRVTHLLHFFQNGFALFFRCVPELVHERLTFGEHGITLGTELLRVLLDVA